MAGRSSTETARRLDDIAAWLGWKAFEMEDPSKDMKRYPP